MKNHAKYWIDGLKLEKHPEGGYYRETYRSKLNIGSCCLPDDIEGQRAVSTAIYYLLEGHDISVFHRIKSDEIWHHYAGSPLTLHFFNAQQEYRTILLGKDIESGEMPQAVIPAGLWFGATVNAPEAYALVGCTVSPGFDFADFEIGPREYLIRHYPVHRGIIEKLSH